MQEKYREIIRRGEKMGIKFLINVWNAAGYPLGAQSTVIRIKILNGYVWI